MKLPRSRLEPRGTSGPSGATRRALLIASWPHPVRIRAEANYPHDFTQFSHRSDSGLLHYMSSHSDGARRNSVQPWLGWPGSPAILAASKLEKPLHQRE
jgi:hypothetical protein